MAKAPENTLETPEPAQAEQSAPAPAAAQQAPQQQQQVQVQVDDADVAEAGSALEPGSMAVVLVYENTWAAPVTTAAHRAGGELTASVRISALDVERQLDALEGVG